LRAKRGDLRYTTTMSDQHIYRKSLLYKSGVKSADYALNHVQGCSHGCRFPCYAMLMKRRFGQVGTYEDWLKPRLVGNALELLDKELPKLRDKIERVFLSFTTDPFMYRQPEVIELTLKILARLNQAGIPAATLTKGAYPVDEIVKLNSENEYGITLVSVDDTFQQKFEPGAAPIRERIAGLRALHEGGFKTWISMEPYPTPNIHRQDITEVLKAVGFVDSIWFGRWNYNRTAGAFKHAPEFYASMSQQVITFGRQRGIDISVKGGTPITDCEAARPPAELALKL
jgi:DNA repair photolyase